MDFDFSDGAGGGTGRNIVLWRIVPAAWQGTILRFAVHDYWEERFS